MLSLNFSTEGIKSLRDRPSLQICVRSYMVLRYHCLTLTPAGGMFHDPAVYEDPEKFNPDRYMSSEVGTKPEHEYDLGQRNDLSFGGGRVNKLAF